MEKNHKQYILSFDAGGTNTRAVVYLTDGQEIGRAVQKTSEIRPGPGAVEHDPEELFLSLVEAGRDALKAASVRAEQITAIGITVQRATFTLWEKESGRPVSPFISWADVRAADTAGRMNRRAKWWLLKKAAAFAGWMSRNTMLTATGMLTFITDHVLVRLKWLFEEHPALLIQAKSGELLFGTLDTWLLYRLTGGKVHATDSGNAGATSLYNPFDRKWNPIFCSLFDIPMGMLPEVKNSADDYGSTEADLFGSPIPIRALAGDQMAALFGHGCFEPGDVKISQGSGSFVDINVGPRGSVSRRGLFPLIAWTIKERPVYMLEGSVATAGTLIDWLGKGIGLSDTPAVLNEFASQCSDTEGVLFIPTASGIRFPYFNPKVRGTIIGLSLSTHRRHLARAVLQGIAHRAVDILEGIEEDTGTVIQQIKVDGGVSRSDVLLQEIANLSGLPVKRPGETDMTPRGVAALAGIGAGIWKDVKEIAMISQNYHTFQPDKGAQWRLERRMTWKRAIKALAGIYN
jgi:glycerol kinase